MQKPLKILVVRFSSIGDIVLTSPVVRILKNQLNAEVHFITKNVYKCLIEYNPNIDKVYSIDTDIKEVVSELKNENYDWIIDLHNNIRSSQLKRIRVKSRSYKKLNLQKFLLTNFGINRMPKTHTVDRFLDTISHLGVKNDGKGLDFFLSKKDEVDILVKDYICFAIGGNHFTKILPTTKIIEICKKINKTIVLIGGEDDYNRAEEIENEVGRKVINLCGKYSINQSAHIMKHAKYLITHDTGFMHIAAAFQMKIYSVFGGTHPDLGFTPYLPNPENKIIQVENLSCRPCHRYGKSKCPEGHFNCMNLIDTDLFIE
ncbi:MAG: glycosyltransferase family 9 protein [Flavobacteriales bacterium]|nr:glycosyltransferase family 9 protein [Flavobacteriales bacterium]